MSEREWCFPMLHDWSKWSALQLGQRTSVFNVDIPALRTEHKSPFYYQTRTCKRCGQEQVRRDV